MFEFKCSSLCHSYSKNCLAGTIFPPSRHVGLHLLYPLLLFFPSFWTFSDVLRVSKLGGLFLGGGGRWLIMAGLQVTVKR